MDMNKKKIQDKYEQKRKKSKTILKNIINQDRSKLIVFEDNNK